MVGNQLATKSYQFDPHFQKTRIHSLHPFFIDPNPFLYSILCCRNNFIFPFHRIGNGYFFYSSNISFHEIIIRCTLITASPIPEAEQGKGFVVAYSFWEKEKANL